MLSINATEEHPMTDASRPHLSVLPPGRPRPAFAVDPYPIPVVRRAAVRAAALELAGGGTVTRMHTVEQPPGGWTVTVRNAIGVICVVHVDPRPHQSYASYS